jgi:hypothetical protein
MAARPNSGPEEEDMLLTVGQGPAVKSLFLIAAHFL